MRNADAGPQITPPPQAAADRLSNGRHPADSVALHVSPPEQPPRRYEQAFSGHPSQVREARRFLAAALKGSPITDDAVLCISELASNSILHSTSSKPGGTFTVRIEVHDGDYLHIEVEDNGGAWQEPPHRDDRPHGLDIIRELADDHGIDGNGDGLTGRIVWARLDWPAPAPPPAPAQQSPSRPAAASTTA